MPIIYDCYDSCISSCYTPVMDSCIYCYDFRDIPVITTIWLHSDYIRLDILWHEIKVYRWGFPCLDYSFEVLVSWDRNLSVYNHFAWNQFYLGFPVSWWLCYTVHIHTYIFHLCSNPPVFWVCHLCSSCFAAWHCIILAWGVSLTPLDLTFRSWS